MFDFTKPPPALTGTAPAPTPTAAPTPQPSPFAAGPVNAAGAMANFGAGKIDLRDPGLPLGFRGKVRWIDSQAKRTHASGFGIYVRVEVVDIVPGCEGGGQCPPPVPKNLNMLPAKVGGVYVIPHRGFGDPMKEAFAISDLKTNLIAALEPKGLTLEKASALPEAQWNAIAQAVCDNDPGDELGIKGTEFLVATSKVDTKSGFGKLKHQFFPTSMIG